MKPVSLAFVFSVLLPVQPVLAQYGSHNNYLQRQQQNNSYYFQRQQQNMQRYQDQQRMYQLQQQQRMQNYQLQQQQNQLQFQQQQQQRQINQMRYATPSPVFVPRSSSTPAPSGSVYSGEHADSKSKDDNLLIFIGEDKGSTYWAYLETRNPRPLLKEVIKKDDNEKRLLTVYDCDAKRYQSAWEISPDEWGEWYKVETPIEEKYLVFACGPNSVPARAEKIAPIEAPPGQGRLPSLPYIPNSSL